jgi:predicted lipoprotein with Yx(FWY)xxD motif
MNKRTLSFSSLVFLAGLGVAACGSDTPAATPIAPAAVPTTIPVATAAPAATTAPSASPAGGSVAVKAGSSSLGQILVDANGNTLYAFTNDTDAKPTCTGACAEAWPPVIVDPSWSVAPGLDSGVFSTVVDSSGEEQLMAGKFPLYRFSGDARPGDVTGQGSGGVWFVVDTEASPIEGDAGPADATAADGSTESTEPTTEAPTIAAPALVTVSESSLGSILTAEDGMTIYGFLADADGDPTCSDGCAKAWPPVIVDADFDVSSLPTPELFTVVERADGTSQLKAGKWPLYYFSGDTAAGETNGQGSGASWFVVAPDGTLVK